MKKTALKLGIILLVSLYFTISAYATTTDIKLELDKKEYIGLNDALNIKITAPSLNTNPKQINYMTAKVYTTDNPVGMNVYLTETNRDTGVFTANVFFSSSAMDPKSKILKVPRPTTIYVKYGELAAEASWKPAEMKLSLDKEQYNGYGVLSTVTITNSDLNLDKKKKEYLIVKVTSSSDPEGINLKLSEESEDSGVFTAEFGFDRLRSDEKAKKLQISYNDTITAAYEALSSSTGKPERWTAASVWKPSTGVVDLNRKEYEGLLSIATVTVKDQDLNLRPEHIDPVKVKVTSETDPRGIILTAYETDVNKGIFSASFNFSMDASNSGKGTLKISPTDKITVTYIDEVDEDNKTNITVTDTAAFTLSEAVISTSAKDDEGIGNMLDIYITDHDENNPIIKDRLIAKVGSGNRTDDLTIWLVETGTDTGKFKCRLYLNNDKTYESALAVASNDNINIKYIDKTIPEGGSKELLKTVKWTLQSSVLTMDDECYIGYNRTAKITLINMTLNEDENRAETVDVKVSSLSSGSMTLELKETSSDSGEFTGTVRFGRSSKRSDGIIGVSGSDIVTVTFENKKDENDYDEFSAEWFAHDAEITLDRELYKGNGAPVRITLEDWDIADNPQEKDEVKVLAKLKGSKKDVSVTLTESSKHSGVFSGILYINGEPGQRPSISLKPDEIIEVIYEDKDTSSGIEESRTAAASWGGISTAVLTLDKTEYIGYDTYMTITLKDPDQNKSRTARDKVLITVETQNGRNNKEYELSETSSDSGEFRVKLKLETDNSGKNSVKVKPEDVITVIFRSKSGDKRVSVTATFSK